MKGLKTAGVKEVEAIKKRAHRLASFERISNKDAQSLILLADKMLGLIEEIEEVEINGEAKQD